MTAEIVIMNREAVAIAADRSVRIVTGPPENPQEIVTSATKIFALPMDHTVSFMVYNNAAFLGIPWEPIITRFGESLGPSPLPALADYAGRFLNFLKTDQDLITPVIEQQYFSSLIYTYYLALRRIFQDSASEMIRELGVINEDQVGEFVAGKVNELFITVASGSPLPGISPSFVKELSTTYDAVTTRAMNEIFEQLPIPDAARVQLKEIPFLYYATFGASTDPASRTFSGLAITGFGKQEIFPSLVSYAIEGRLAGTLKYRQTKNKKITLETGAWVIPFEHQEMVDIFMSGIDPKLTDALVESLSEVFNQYPQAIVDSIETMNDEEKADVKTRFQPKTDELVTRISTYMTNYRASNVAPVINVVVSLPKSELAAMAESLVSLTSLKRKVSGSPGIHGGAIEVAVISKRDGLVWIRKKPYFDREINPQVAEKRM
jgi:hypothetical protein